MDEAIGQGGELIVGITAAVFMIGIIMLLLSNTDAGVLRIYLTHLLEAAC